MNPIDPKPDDLERLTRRALAGLPGRTAPPNLEARVLAALEARAALPWWRTPFAAWPGTARVAFVLLSLALVSLTVLLGRGAETDAPLAWVRGATGLVSSVGGFFALFARLVPDTWLYAALGLGGVLYAMLFGLGAVIYRTLYLPSLKR